MPPSIMYAAYSSILHSKEKTGRILGTWHQYLMNFRASALLRNIQNIRICMGEKTFCFCNQRKWKDFNKKQFTLLKMCVTSLLCSPRADLSTFSGFLCKRLSLYINVYPGGGGVLPHITLAPRANQRSQISATSPVWSHRLRLGLNSSLPLKDSDTAWDSNYSHSGWETLSCSRWH